MYTRAVTDQGVNLTAEISTEQHFKRCAIGIYGRVILEFN